MKVLLGLALACSLAACNSVPTAALTARYGPMDLEGDLGVSSAAAVVTSTSEALGIEEDSSVLSPRFDLSWLAFDIWASYYDMSLEGQGTAEGEFNLGGVVITAGEPTDTAFDMMLGTGGVTVDLVPGETFDLGIGLGFGYVDFDASITSLTTSLTVNSTENFLMPLAAARAAIEVSSLELSVSAAGFSAEIEGDEATVVDGDAMLRWHFLDAGPLQGGLVAGYRLTTIEALYESDGSTVDADLEFSGPYAGLTIEL